MVKLTDTMVDLADCHTTLYYLGAKAPDGAPLPLHAEGVYRDLYKSISPPASKRCADLRPDHSSAVLDKLSPAYRDNKYWHRYMATRNYGSYAAAAWRNLVPFAATLKARVEFAPDPAFAFKVSPVPRVLVYPFGWTTWLSLRLVGEYGLPDLAAFMERLFDDHAKPFRVVAPGQAPAPLSLRGFFDLVAQGVRGDAFGGDDTDTDSQDFVTVVTVLAKHGGSLSLGALDDEAQKLLRRIVSPDGPPPSSPFDEHVYRVVPESEVEYVVAEKYGRFIWLNELLRSEDRNRQKLHCHHNNTLTSLVQALHLRELIDEGVKRKPLPETLKAVLESAKDRLTEPRYRNASLVLFLGDESVKESVDKIEKLLKSDKP